MTVAKIYQGVVVANGFNFFMSAGQACLIPFLSLYFLYLDLNPLQTGLLLGIKALTGSLSSAFWTQCLTTTSRRLKFVLVFSLTILVASHLVMVLMPSMKADKSDNFCPPLRKGFSSLLNCSQVDNETICSVTTVIPGFNDTRDLTNSTESFINTPLWSNTTGNEVNNYQTTTIKTTTPKPTSLENFVTKVVVISAGPPQLSVDSWDNSNKTKTTLKKVISSQDKQGSSFNGLNDYWGNDNSDFHNREKRHDEHAGMDMSKEASTNLQKDGPETHPIDYLESFPTTAIGKDYGILENRLKSIQNQVFSAMLILVIVSEMFSSPCQHVADELYASFLENHDLPLTRRRTTGCWSLLGGAITPWIIVIIIDHLPCHVPPSGSHRILFHFWLFTLIHSLSFLFSICFPSSSSSVPPDVSRTPSGVPLPHHHHQHHHHHHSRRWANLARGLKLVASDGRAVLATITIFIVGFVQGSSVTYLPWVIHDLVGDESEFYIGAAIGMAAFGDLLARFLGGWICKKLGHVAAILFGLLITATRLALYGFIFKPWMAIIGESVHFFGAALVVAAVTDHPAFKMTTKGIDGEGGTPKKRKHARGYGSMASFAAAESMSVNSALRLIQSGVGFSAGCCIAGLLGKLYGIPMAFWAAAGTALVWCLIFGILYPCCKSRCMSSGRNNRKKKSTGLASSLLAGRYKKLSRDDKDDDEDEEEEDDEDDYDVDEDVSTEEEKADWMMRKHVS